jgi:hypothetical protein
VADFDVDDLDRGAVFDLVVVFERVALLVLALDFDLETCGIGSSSCQELPSYPGSRRRNRGLFVSDKSGSERPPPPAEASRTDP